MAAPQSDPAERMFAAMSGDQENTTGGETPDDVLAGEYALGLLDAEHRTAVERRAADEPEFAALIASWRNEFSAFDEAYAPATPPAHIFQSIETRLHGAEPPQSWWSSIAFWRPLALSVASAFVILVAVTVNQVALPPATQMVTVLESDEGGLNSVVLYDPSTATLRMTVLETPAGAGSDAELWLVQETGTPVSLGILPRSGRLERSLSEELRSQILPGATFAVSLEPSGGSPTGTATGPIVAIGLLAEI